MLPKRVEVIRLFNRDFINNPKLPEMDSDDWISIDYDLPSQDICYVKNSTKVFKAIYLHGYKIPTPSKWADCVKNKFIDKDEITHWMPMGNG